MGQTRNRIYYWENVFFFYRRIRVSLSKKKWIHKLINSSSQTRSLMNPTVSRLDHAETFSTLADRQQQRSFEVIVTLIIR